MRSLVDLFLHPLTCFWLSALFAAMIARKYQRSALLLFTLALGWLALTSTPPLPRFLTATLEDQFSPLFVSDFPVLSDSATHIVVLGGGHTMDTRLPSNDQLSEKALKRLVEGIRLYRGLAGSKLVCSGYSHAELSASHAEILADAAVALGVSRQDIELLPTPRNTMEEAIAYRDKFGRHHKLVLVTSAVHMPRAVMHFQQAGLTPLPAPTHFLIKRDNLLKKYSIKPSYRHLAMTYSALHELLGLVHGKYEWRKLKRQNADTLRQKLDDNR